MHYSLFQRVTMNKYFAEVKRWLEHPALLAGCVCGTFSKEVKLVPVVDAERNIDRLLIFLSLRSPFTCITVYSNVLL